MKLNDAEVTKQATELFSKTFEPMDEEQFYYKHFENPERLEKPVRYFMNNGRICAMNAFDQVTVLAGQQEIKAIQSSDSAVDAECRGQGLFYKIQTETLQEYAKEGGALAFGIPNEKSFPIFMKMGWMDIGTLAGYRKMVNLFGCMKSLLGRTEKPQFCEKTEYSHKGYTVIVGKNRDIINERDIQTINEDIVVGVKRSLAYYKWKVFEHTDIEYGIVKVIKEDVLQALFIVTRKKGSHFVFADVSEWYIASGAGEKQWKIMAEILQKNLKNWCDFSTINFVNPKSGEDKIVNCLGYKQKGEQEYRLIVNVLEKDMKREVEDIKYWKLRGIDPDTMLN